MKTIKRVILPLFIFLMLVLTIPHDAVVKGATTTLTNWDDENIGSTQGETGLINYTMTSGDNFEIAGDEPTHGSVPYALKVESHRTTDASGLHENDEGWINLTDNISYIGSLEIKAQIYFTSSVSWGQIQMVFYNNSVEVLNIRMHTDTDHAPDRRFMVRDSTGAWNVVWPDNFVNTNYNSITLTITHVSGNLMNYTWHNTGGTYLLFAGDYSTVDGNDWVTFDSIFVNATHQKGAGSDYVVELDIDDMVIDTDPTDGLYSCDISSYDDYDNWDAGMGESAVSTGFLFLEFRERAWRTNIIKGFDLHIADNTRSGSALEDYHLYITGIPVGIADDFIEQTNGWIVRWCGFAIEIDDEEPVFEVKCDRGFLDIWTGLYTGYDPKVYTQAMHSNDDYRYGNGAVDGTEISRFNYVKWSYYYDTIVPYEEAPEYDDTVWVNGETFRQFDPVWISWTAENLTYQNTILVYKSTGELMFSEDVDTYDGSIQWTPDDYGDFTASLNRINNVSSDNFTVTASTTGIGIWSQPNPSNINSNYNVYWSYNNSDGNDGVIYQGYNSNPADAVFYRYVTSNTTGSFSTVEVRQESTTYWFLGIEHTTAWSLEATHLHFNLIAGIPSNSISVAYDEIALDGSGNGVTQTVHYSHRHFGQTVRIYDGNRLIRTTEDYIGDFSYDPIGVGFHQLYMYVVDVGNGTQIMIANTSFVVVLSSEEGTWRDVFPVLHPTLGMVIGVMVTGMFTLMPLFFSIGFSKKQIHIPSVAYPMFSCMGIIICVTFGFFQPWVLFFVLAVGIIIVTIMYLQSKGGST